MNRTTLLIILAYLLIINAVAFLLMLIDKKKAKKHKRRIPEVVLFGVAIAGGSIGTLAGMEIFRHKTKHASFFIGIPAIIVLQIALVVAFYTLIM